MATAPEQEKYEVLETIGMIKGNASVVISLTMLLGRGSFGTIRKVRRAVDGHVRCTDFRLGCHR